MSEAEDKKIFELEKEIVGLNEMVFLILEAVGEPVWVDTKKFVGRNTTDKVVSILLDEDSGQWKFEVTDAEVAEALND